MTTQEKIFAHILKYKKKHGVVPSARFLSKYFGMTAQGMSFHYNALIEQGKLRKLPEPVIYEVIPSGSGQEA